MDEDMEMVGASKKVEAQYVEMKVPLYSYGCEKKVKKALSHIRGIYSVKVDYYQQKVTVWGICNKFDVLARIKRKRKEARFWNPDDNLAVAAIKETQSPPSSSAVLPVRSTSLISWRAVIKNVFSS